MMNEVNFNEKINIVNNNILNKVYAQLVRESLNNNHNEENEVRWETYAIIMSELKGECDYNTYDEIKYRITDGENPNIVFYDIINRGDYLSSLIWQLKPRIELFIEEDSYNRFYK